MERVKDVRPPADMERVSPLRDETQSRPPDWWRCTACGTQTPLQPDQYAVDKRYGWRRCASCKKRQVFQLT